MQKKHLIVIGVLALCLVLCISAGCTSTSSSGSNSSTNSEYVATVDILQIPAGSQINSLSLGQIDGMMTWQPNVSVAKVSGVGTVVSYSQNLPRDDGGSWKEHTCCVFGANSKGIENKELATVLTGMMLLGNQYIADHPVESTKAVANWMYGTTPLSINGKSIAGEEVISNSLPTINFSTEITEKWLNSNYEFLETQRSLGAISNNLASTSKTDTAKLIYDFTSYEAAKKIIDNKGKFPTPTSGKIGIGYLLSDHDAPLFVLVKNWEYFKEKYNTYLKPKSDKDGAVNFAELYVNGEKVCDVDLVVANAGPELMTALQSNNIQYAIAGTPPYLSSIDIQTGLKILSPIMTEGSALVVNASAPVKNWDDFVKWAIQRSAEGNNLKIAIPQPNSIQDIQLQSAIKSAKIKYSTK